jgi:hypothetical protein
VEPLDPDEVLGFTIVRAHHLVARRFHSVLAQVSLTPTQFGVLTILAHNPEMTQGSLARAVLASQGAQPASGDRRHGLRPAGRAAASLREISSRLPADPQQLSLASPFGGESLF